jgi:hypothetical protein
LSAAKLFCEISTLAGVAFLCFIFLTSGTARAAASAAGASARLPESPRDYYNAGTKQFHDGKLREAESSLQTAVQSNDERLQPAALYNLGQVRFQQGALALKDAPNSKTAKERGDAACDSAGQAIRAADAALAGDDLEAITRAYLRGKGARKQLKAAQEAVKKAMQAHGAVLARWQRATGDFKSAHELQAAFEDARFNGEVVDRWIAALVDQLEMMKMAATCMGDKRQELKGRMDQLKKRIPDGPKKDQEGDDDEDDEDEDQPPKEPKSGQMEKENKPGKEMALTWEEAMRLLDSLKLDANRKLPMGEKETANQKQRHGRDW